MSTISFARGVPAPECLPVEALADCARAALQRDGKTILSYGTGAGYGPLRARLAAQHGVDESRIFLTNGSLQGFVFLAQRLARGKRVLVERPSYDRPLKILHELGADIVALDCDDDGLDPDALERALAEGDAPAFLYLIPTFQNPSGRTLPLDRRRRVVELAEQHDLLVLEDDPYGLVRYEGDPLPSLFELSEGRIAYSSSYSKTISPGLRVGWFVFTEELTRRIATTANDTYISPVLLGQATVNEFIEQGLFEPNLERVCGLLGARRDAMQAALARDLPDLAVSRPEGGYFLWAEQDGIDAGELLRRGEEAGVTFVKGTDCGGPAGSLRLAFSYVSLDEIDEGVARLASLLSAAPA
jgi:2-aminoadipate transaminase